MISWERKAVLPGDVDQDASVVRTRFGWIVGMQAGVNND